MRLNSLITFFCPFLHANSNSLSTRNSYHRPTRIFSRVNQDCVDRDTGTALLHCPVWWSLISSLDLHWCHNPVHLWPQDFYTQDISGVWALVLKQLDILKPDVQPVLGLAALFNLVWRIKWALSFSLSCLPKVGSETPKWRPICSTCTVKITQPFP